jgi:GNAT superfamily N-acetyltransferase
VTSVEVREMLDTDRYYVGTCTHVRESAEIDACAERRIRWMERLIPIGLKVTVAITDGLPRGFLYLLPIEICPWGPLGHGLSAVPCLCVENAFHGRGLGKALLLDAVQRSQKAGYRGITIQAYTHDFWFMQAAFFLKHGFIEVARQGEVVLLWQPFDDSVSKPRMLESQYRYIPTEGKVVVDLFWNEFCQTSDIEAQRVRQVVAEFADSVLLHEYLAEDRETLLRYQLPRGIYVNGKEIFWGHEAPVSGIRDAIEKALVCSNL